MSNRFHPFSEIFPLLDGPALQELADDIKQHGLREPIWTFGGLILDGRNRFLACQKANVKPIMRAYVGSEAQALAWVVSANIHRRHLNDTQRATAAAKISNLRSGQRSAEMKSAVPIGTAAEMLNVSERQVKRARKVEEKGGKRLKEAVAHGDISLSRAAAVADLPKSEQLAAAQSSDPPTHTTAAASAKDRPEASRITGSELGAAPGDEGAPDATEIAEAEAALIADQEAMAKLLEADDKLAWAMGEVKRLSGLLRIAEQSRDEAINGKGAMTKLLKAEQRKTERLEKRVKALESENEALRERTAVMGERAA